MPRRVFVTGATGYLGRPLCERLQLEGHSVVALTRPGSEERLPAGAIAALGDALDPESYLAAVAGADTFVHLVGTPHPSPAKAREFRSVDLVSVQAAVSVVARTPSVRHFVYLSVAHPAPIMQAYIDVRIEGEALVRGLGIPATIARPFYVLGPGHRWFYVSVPLFVLLRRIPFTRDGANRLAPVTLPQMLAALVASIGEPPDGVRILEAPAIRDPLASGERPRHVTEGDSPREEA
jgi:uncharacterized protein YbjT (DUF2867 family)